MLKKIVLTSSILALTAGVALANTAPYIGASTGVTTNTANKTGGSYRGMPFNVFAGYGGVVSQSFYLAGELTGTIANADISNNGLRSTSGIGISVIPGVMLSDHTMAFARAGVVRTHFSVPGTSGQNQTGGQMGLGLQTSLTQNVDLRGEYDYVAYRSVNTYGISLKPRTDQYTLGLVYKFD